MKITKDVLKTNYNTVFVVNRDNYLFEDMRLYLFDPKNESDFYKQAEILRNIIRENIDKTYYILNMYSSKDFSLAEMSRAKLKNLLGNLKNVKYEWDINPQNIRFYGYIDYKYTLHVRYYTDSVAVEMIKRKTEVLYFLGFIESKTYEEAVQYFQDLAKKTYA